MSTPAFGGQWKRWYVTFSFLFFNFKLAHFDKGNSKDKHTQILQIEKPKPLLKPRAPWPRACWAPTARISQTCFAGRAGKRPAGGFARILLGEEHVSPWRAAKTYLESEDLKKKNLWNTDSIFFTSCCTLAIAAIRREIALENSLVGPNLGNANFMPHHVFPKKVSKGHLSVLVQLLPASCSFCAHLALLMPTALCVGWRRGAKKTWGGGCKRWSRRKRTGARWQWHREPLFKNTLLVNSLPPYVKRVKPPLFHT